MSNEDLALQVQSGNAHALDELTRQNGGILTRVAWKLYYAHGGQENTLGLELDDCQQIAFLGLYNAALAYDPAKGFKLLSYLGFQTRRAFREMYYKQGKDALPHARSGDAAISEDMDETELWEAVPDPQAREAFDQGEECECLRQLQESVHAALDALPAHQAESVRMVYLHGLERRQAAERKGISAQAVRGHIDCAFRTLRRCRELREYAREAERRRELRCAAAYRGTGWGAYLANQASVQERVTEWQERRNAV